jgi:hypothetical protein
MTAAKRRVLPRNAAICNFFSCYLSRKAFATSFKVKGQLWVLDG